MTRTFDLSHRDARRLVSRDGAAAAAPPQPMSFFITSAGSGKARISHRRRRPHLPDAGHRRGSTKTFHA
jgi:hypothetical protein